MAYKLKTSKKTQDYFATIGANTGLQPFALSKLSIALSIRQGKLSDSDFAGDNEGLELSRQTIFGEYDLLFKSLIANCEGHAISDNNYFPRLVKAHLDRGAKLLYEENRYSKNLFLDLCDLDKQL